MRSEGKGARERLTVRDVNVTRVTAMEVKGK